MALTKLAREAAKKAREKARQAAAKKAAEAAKKKAAAKGKAEVTKATKPPRVATGGAGKGGGGKEVSPKRQAQIDAEKRLTKRNVKEPAERKSNLSSTAKEVAPRIERLQKLKDAMQSNKKKDLAPTRTKREAGGAAKRTGTDFTLQQQRRMQASYDGKKAQVAWLKKNDPKSPRIADLQKEMDGYLSKAASIKKTNKVEPKRPPGSRKPSEVRSAGLASTRKELMDITQKLNTVGNQKLIANLKKQGKKVPRLTTKQVDDLKARKKMLQAKLDKMVKK
jgi:hypothetical protein